LNAIVEVKKNSLVLLKNYSRSISRDEKAIIINLLLRKFPISNNNNVLERLSENRYEILSQDTGISINTINIIIEKFLYDISVMKAFYKDFFIIWEPNLKKFERKVRCFLHKIHRIAPVFNYNRARVNLRILINYLEKINFWPKISTQVCLVIFITDINDKEVDESSRLIQKNLRVLCNCSAYAFHRTRNKIGFNP